MDASDELSKMYDERLAAGRAFIQNRWRYLLPQTKRLLALRNGYDHRGLKLNSEDQFDDTRDLEYSLGVFQEAAKANLPSKKGDAIPGCYVSDDVLNEARNLLFDRQMCDPEFISTALHACIKHQVSYAVEAYYANGGGSSPTGLGAFLRLIWGIVVGLGLPIAVGNGLAEAFKGDGASASVLALIAMFCYSSVKSLNEKQVGPKKPEEIAYSYWTSLVYRNFHIGSGHGVQAQLEEMMHQKLRVPSVLFDLCAVLQQGTQYVNRGELEGQEHREAA